MLAPFIAFLSLVTAALRMRAADAALVKALQCNLTVPSRAIARRQYLEDQTRFETTARWALEDYRFADCWDTCTVQCDYCGNHDLAHNTTTDAAGRTACYPGCPPHPTVVRSDGSVHHAKCPGDDWRVCGCYDGAEEDHAEMQAEMMADHAADIALLEREEAYAYANPVLVDLATWQAETPAPITCASQGYGRCGCC